MTTQDALRVIRDIRQDLRNLHGALDGRLIEEVQEAAENLMLAHQSIAFALDDLDLAVTKLSAKSV